LGILTATITTMTVAGVTSHEYRWVPIEIVTPDDVFTKQSVVVDLVVSCGGKPRWCSSPSISNKFQ
jgi:hypothetical protein